MPAWGWLPEPALDDLARYVGHLTRRGLAQRALERARLEGRELSDAEAHAQAAAMFTPGRAVVVPRPQAAMGAVYELGRSSYARHCAACHGADGRGAQIGPEVNPDGSPNWARDFTAGFLKGGGSHRALATRIVAGMPGTTMSSFAALPQDELAALTTYVSSLVPIEADCWLVHDHKPLNVARVGAGAPLASCCDATDERWAAASEIDVVLAPLSWRNDAPFAAKLAALHDGESIVFRVRWRDASRDEGSLELDEARDAAALAFSNESAPPLFGMGSRAHPVNLWHWQALRLIDRAGVLDLVEATPHVPASPLFGEARADARPHYLPAPSDPPSGGELDELAAESFAALRDLDAGGKAVRAAARWAGGEWAVVFERRLAPRNSAEADLRPGRPALVALAIWDGTGGDRGGQKSFSIWQQLAVE
jgi:mono/diheme cytochrome c family protein